MSRLSTLIKIVKDRRIRERRLEDLLLRMDDIVRFYELRMIPLDKWQTLTDEETSLLNELRASRK